MQNHDRRLVKASTTGLGARRTTGRELPAQVQRGENNYSWKAKDRIRDTGGKDSMTDMEGDWPSRGGRERKKKFF